MICCFDPTQYTGTPDAEPCPVTLDVPQIIRGLDELYNSGRENEAGEYLAQWLIRAREVGDWRAELSIVSEQLGQCRRSGDRRLGEDSVNAALTLVREHRLGRTVSGATVLLNAATTLKLLGGAESSLPIFRHVARVFADNLDPLDYRLAGLYNNMALAYCDCRDIETAEKYFRLAISIVSNSEHPENEIAVTYCNMAEMYGSLDTEDKRIEECLDRAYENLSSAALPHDGYFRFTVSKCLPCFDKFGFFLYAKSLREAAASC